MQLEATLVSGERQGWDDFERAAIFAWLTARTD
jgi:hypothetical protein